MIKTKRRNESVTALRCLLRQVPRNRKKGVSYKYYIERLILSSRSKGREAAATTCLLPNLYSRYVDKLEVNGTHTM